jgi:NAD(P)-dependent dehydrogenase (short-subunit alcohol dehydrogenase family)
MTHAAPGPPPADLTGRTIIVTGGARGLGAACCHAMADRGARVVVADRLVDGNAVSDALAAAGAEALFVQTDVADERSARELVRVATDRFGAIDALVNNAAIYMELERKTPFEEIATDAWDRVMAVNARGPFNCAKAAAPSMRERRSGKIVNVSSSSVHHGIAGFAHYVASKAAVIGLTHALARELGPDGICVNAIAPGLVSNEASLSLNADDDAYLKRAAAGRALGREMRSEDLVGTIAFLASPASDFVTGQTFIVDGGGVMT